MRKFIECSTMIGGFLIFLWGDYNWWTIQSTVYGYVGPGSELEMLSAWLYVAMIGSIIFIFGAALWMKRYLDNQKCPQCGRKLYSKLDNISQEDNL